MNEDALDLTLEESQDVILGLGVAMQKWFELLGGINYVTARFAAPGEDVLAHHLTVQKTGNPTAHDLRQVAEARVAKLEKQLRDHGMEPDF